MAALTIVTDFSLTTAVSALTNQTGGSTLPSIILDKNNISSAVGMSDGSTTPLSVTSSNGSQPGLPTEADSSFARGYSNSVRYGQIFPRTVYGN